MSGDLEFYLNELKAEECVCGGSKKRGFAFCYQCYKTLPVHLQRDLYRQIMHGFEEAYDESVEYLKDEGRVL